MRKKCIFAFCFLIFSGQVSARGSDYYGVDIGPLICILHNPIYIDFDVGKKLAKTGYYEILFEKIRSGDIPEKLECLKRKAYVPDDLCHPFMSDAFNWTEDEVNFYMKKYEKEIKNVVEARRFCEKLK